jgi:hypothetical protein
MNPMLFLETFSSAPHAGSIPAKLPGKTSRKKSELDSALGQISDESIAETKEEFQHLLAQAKATLASSSGKMQRNSNGVWFS